MVFIIVATFLICLVYAVLTLISIYKGARIAQANWAKYHTNAEYSPAWTGQNGKRYKMHIPSQRIIAA